MSRVRIEYAQALDEHARWLERIASRVRAGDDEHVAELMMGFAEATRALELVAAAMDFGRFELARRILDRLPPVDAIRTGVQEVLAAAARGDVLEPAPETWLDEIAQRIFSPAYRTRPEGARLCIREGMLGETYHWHDELQGRAVRDGDVLEVWTESGWRRVTYRVQNWDLFDACFEVDAEHEAVDRETAWCRWPSDPPEASTG
ncbi:hypothetical protein [Deinococcus geothermalis]|uniref:hypothetical protein n=1 Tax=Deinococcus geothermalis TaxID=68909 RepID=UPI00030EF9CD|nr:hypothetical protein [Deinococcus geothermalis]